MTIRFIDTIDNQVPGFQEIINNSIAIVEPWVKEVVDNLAKSEETVAGFEEFLSFVPTLVAEKRYNSDVVTGDWVITKGITYYAYGYLNVSLKGIVATDEIKDALRKGVMLGAQDKFIYKIKNIRFNVVSSDGVSLIDTTLNLSSIKIDGNGTLDISFEDPSNYLDAD